MVMRSLHIGVFALLLLTGRVLGQDFTRSKPTPTSSASTSLNPAATFVSPSVRRPDHGGLSESQKVGISVGATLASIIIVGSIAILCVIRRRRKALARPETRLSGDIEAENAAVGDGGTGKAEDAYYMNPALAPHHGALPQAPDGFIYEGGGYAPIPAQAYAPQQQQQQQTQGMGYPIAPAGETYFYSAATYPGTTMTDPTQQHGYAGPSTIQYQTEAYSQPQPPPQQFQQQQFQQQQQQQQQPQGGDISWIYPTTTTSPVDAAPFQDFQHMYLQDYQQQAQGTNTNTSQDQPQNAGQAHQEGGYAHHAVPPPHPHASELPDQRKPVELMGEGHYKEAP